MKFNLWIEKLYKHRKTFSGKPKKREKEVRASGFNVK